MRNSFQQFKSEWDDRLIPISGSDQPIFDPNIPRPGVFSQVMTNYIDFEVNNHVAADAMRKLVFGMFVGFIVTGWILLGIFVGAIPLGWLFSTSKKSQSNDKPAGMKLRQVPLNVDSNTLSDLTNRVTLALDSDWLKKLEDRVKSESSLIKTYARCCVLPKDQIDGMVECQIVKEERENTNIFKCLSKLIYNFQFGPTSSESGSTESSSSNLIV
jgi:hypothetical protein